MHLSVVEASSFAIGQGQEDGLFSEKVRMAHRSNLCLCLSFSGYSVSCFLETPLLNSNNTDPILNDGFRAGIQRQVLSTSLYLRDMAF